MRHLPIIGLLLLSVSCWAQVTHDVDSTTTKQLGVSTFNWSHGGGTLTNGAVVIGVSIYGNGVAAPEREHDHLWCGIRVTDKASGHA
jgi:hypothetical protein